MATGATTSSHPDRAAMVALERTPCPAPMDLEMAKRVEDIELEYQKELYHPMAISRGATSARRRTGKMNNGEWQNSIVIGMRA